MHNDHESANDQKPDLQNSTLDQPDQNELIPLQANSQPDAQPMVVPPNLKMLAAQSRQIKIFLDHDSRIKLMRAHLTALEQDMVFDRDIHVGTKIGLGITHLHQNRKALVAVFDIKLEADPTKFVMVALDHRTEYNLRKLGVELFNLARRDASVAQIASLALTFGSQQ
jgi:hypothetical protein